MTSLKQPDLATLITRLIALRPCGKGEAISGFLDILDQAVSADAFTVLRVDAVNGSAQILGGRGLLTPEDRWSQRLEAPHVAKQAANFPDMPAIAAVGSFVCDPLLAEEQARSLAMSRVGVGKKHLMTIAIRREGTPFSDEEIQRFAAVAGVINLVGRCWHLEQDRESRQERDTLTGLGRFSAFHEGLGKELSRARRGVGCVTIGILSLENTGKETPPDDAIVAVAEVLEEQLRNFDTLTRYSSTEFAFVLPDLKVAEGLKVMERLQGDIEAALAPFSEPSWTCIGLAGYPDDAASLERLIEMAEAAANQAKEAGNSAVRRWKE
jgi:diguanylate cyclase (GGDEF)-like protein